MLKHWKKIGAGCCAVAILLGVLAVSQLASGKSDYIDISDEATPLAAQNPGPGVLTPQASGTQVHDNEYATIDASNVNQGYVMVKYNQVGDSTRIKVRVTRTDGTTYTYDMATDGNYRVFPFTEGNGTYNVSVYRNVSGTQYAKVLSQDLSVQLASDLLPFLYPNEYVNFTAQSQVVQLGNQVAGNAQDELKTVENVYNYVVGNISYDYDLAANTPVGYLPNLDNVIATKKGICFDYASMMAAMLRSQGIPTKLVIGYTSKGEYHAWITTHISEVGWVNGVISFDGQSWQLMDPTFASTGKASESVLDYITNPGNYTAKYCY